MTSQEAGQAVLYSKNCTAYVRTPVNLPPQGHCCGGVCTGLIKRGVGAVHAPTKVGGGERLVGQRHPIPNCYLLLRRSRLTVVRTRMCGWHSQFTHAGFQLVHTFDMVDRAGQSEYTPSFSCRSALLKYDGAGQQWYHCRVPRLTVRRNR